MMAKEQILAVDDEEDIVELVRYNLEREGYQMICATNGDDALKSVRKSIPAVILLDLMLPDMDGLEITRLLKADAMTRSIPIIMLTAKGEEADIVTGLELGADDYITKPFSPRVMTARVKAVLRRKSQEDIDAPEYLKIHNLLIRPGRREVLVDGERVELTFTEFGILYCLARRPGWVFTRYKIVDAVRGDEYPVTDRSVDVQIVGLRKKLGQAGQYIETVRGVGYRFKE
jgi:two-component system phosphate regulon response regulator PhoB